MASLFMLNNLYYMSLGRKFANKISFAGKNSLPSRVSIDLFYSFSDEILFYNRRRGYIILNDHKVGKVNKTSLTVTSSLYFLR